MRLMVSAYAYLFYRIDRGFSARSLDSPFQATAIVSTLLVLNVITLSLLVEPLGIPIIQKGQAVTLVLVILAINSVVFLNPSRLDRIRARWEKQTPRSRRWGTGMVLSYVILTVATWLLCILNVLPRVLV